MSELITLSGIRTIKGENMKCKEIENRRSCPWEDCPDFNNDWCKNCASYENEDESDQ